MRNLGNYTTFDEQYAYTNYEWNDTFTRAAPVLLGRVNQGPPLVKINASDLTVDAALAKSADSAVAPGKLCHERVLASSTDLTAMLP